MADKVSKKVQINALNERSGLYLHIPWCRQICHYCDFAKTANHSPELRLKFLDTLYLQTNAWLTWYREKDSSGLSSVFFGGGTPSLYTSEYESLMTLVRAHSKSHAEITLEANPDDITIESLKVWRGLGFNRISLGVQSFDPLGLKAMHRIHSKDQAIKAVEMALSIFPTVNIDLIYGWQTQTISSWEEDLKTAVNLNVPHLSLYNLTYEPRTVIGRMAARGKIEPADDKSLEFYYLIACAHLAKAGFIHEEVSNWSKPGHSCSHNWLYWSDRPYLGVGPGAHGYLPQDDGIGIRYAYDRNERSFTSSSSSVSQLVNPSVLPVAGIVIEDDRSIESWIIEAIGSSLRTERGVDLAYISRKSGKPFKIGKKLEAGISSGALKLIENEQRLIASPNEWFREHYWALAVIAGFE
jgi:oxygen-independent coproporphyrinogen-3 oxidase